MLLKLVIIFLLIFIFFNLKNFLKVNKKILKTNKFITFNKKNLNNWMNLTKKERYNSLKQDSLNYMDKRKILLEEIRDEYKKISRENSEENIKKK